MPFLGKVDKTINSSYHFKCFTVQQQCLFRNDSILQFFIFHHGARWILCPFLGTKIVFSTLTPPLPNINIWRIWKCKWVYYFSYYSTFLFSWAESCKVNMEEGAKCQEIHSHFHAGIESDLALKSLWISLNYMKKNS